MKRAFVYIIFFLPGTAIHAQQNFRGKVVDAVSRQPLENVTVVNVAKPANSTLTDHNGNFILISAGNTPKLLASFVGYKPTTITSGDKTELTIELQPDVINLKDVVILTNGHLSKFSTLSKI